jgi:hypothetical protein
MPTHQTTLHHITHPLMNFHHNDKLEPLTADINTSNHITKQITRHATSGVSNTFQEHLSTLDYCRNQARFKVVNTVKFC